MLAGIAKFADNISIKIRPLQQVQQPFCFAFLLLLFIVLPFAIILTSFRYDTCVLFIYNQWHYGVKRYHSDTMQIHLYIEVT